MSSKPGEMASSIVNKKQVKIIVNTNWSNCPRLSRFRNYKHSWGRAKLIPRKRNEEEEDDSDSDSNSNSNSNSLAQHWKKKKKKKKKMKSKQRLSGFFQAQLLKPRLNKLMKKKSLTKQGNMSSINKQLTGPILKKHMPNKRRIHDLPQELLAQILSTLPVKYILRCRSVNKSWYSLIQTPIFITLQLNYQKKNHLSTIKYLLFNDGCIEKLTLRFDDVQCHQYCKIKFLPGLPKDAWFAQSYGLVCVSIRFNDGINYIRNIYLWNPLIQKYKTLPHPPTFSEQNSQALAWEALAFGFVPEENDYVVVHITKPCLHPNSHSVIIGVYSLNTNSWKKFIQDNVFIHTRRGSRDNVVFVNGSAFWLMVNSDRKKILMCFDTKTHILREISLPDWVGYQPTIPTIHQFGQSIVYFLWEPHLVHFDMWVLKDDPINEFTWEKKMCVSPSMHAEEEVLGIRNNGEPILAKSNNLITYNLSNRKANTFVDSWDCWTTHSPYVISPFVETLVLLYD